ncbi:hypothetical protein CONPUDRAFT_167409 [Coniophora puteana RWD-64-598 SS2]|uniref:Uncharacterized protein n=1 Tax=Coniophora puteana (strain RWD-64-598) TaxID=741705 RepID=A0A5M3MH52_CONPW|nr:uncharacterized protein CONPUDRAFT_167409 [Coniophora puteana RWD-64-598 SS2]EIW78387.1 hypothetical protein CONPUDRAFT_167409 [Coniophora puteana RWD-64-598 SS2]
MNISATKTVNMFVKLVPTTSRQSNRYCQSAHIEPTHTAIAAGNGNVARAEPQHDVCASWTGHIHPEGKRYHAMNWRDFRVVTEDNIHDSEVSLRLTTAIQWIDEVAIQSTSFNPGFVELFIELCDSDKELVCRYYFVDHAAKTQFWLDSVSTEELGLDAAVSSSHHRHQLEHLYWIHVDFFCVHLAPELSPVIQDELINVLIHAQGDHMTSSTSTFPYSSDKCEGFVKLLSHRGHALDPYTLCVVARLWGVVAQHRFTTYYGECNPQLDRFQIMQPYALERSTWAIGLCNRMLWNMPRLYEQRLDDVFANDQVYVHLWHDFMTLCTEDWRTSLAWTFPTLISSSLLLIADGCALMTLPGVLTSYMSVISCVTLICTHQNLAKGTASTAARFLKDAQSPTSGMLPLAIVYGLPKALSIWSIICFGGQILFMLYRYLGVGVASGILFSLLSLVIGITRVIAGIGFTCRWHLPSLSYIFRRTGLLGLASPEERQPLDEKPETLV